MKKRHKSSGIVVATDVYFYEDIRKYNPGFILINSNKMGTQRIAPDPTMYSAEKEAEEVSMAFGEKYLARHLSGAEKLDFDKSMDIS